MGKVQSQIGRINQHHHDDLAGRQSGFAFSMRLVTTSDDGIELVYTYLIYEGQVVVASSLST